MDCLLIFAGVFIGVADESAVLPYTLSWELKVKPPSRSSQIFIWSQSSQRASLWLIITYSLKCTVTNRPFMMGTNVDELFCLLN